MSTRLRVIGIIWTIATAVLGFLATIDSGELPSLVTAWVTVSLVLGGIAVLSRPTVAPISLDRDPYERGGSEVLPLVATPVRAAEASEGKRAPRRIVRAVIAAIITVFMVLVIGGILNEGIVRTLRLFGGATVLLWLILYHFSRIFLWAWDGHTTWWQGTKRWTIAFFCLLLLPAAGGALGGGGAHAFGQGVGLGIICSPVAGLLFGSAISFSRFLVRAYGLHKGEMR
jgi:hypothetical protein